MPFESGNTYRRNQNTPQPQISPHHTDLISMWWSVGKSGYPYRDFKMLDGTVKKIRLHRIIASRIKGRKIERWEDVDHRNHNKLDARDKNLNVVSHKQNLQHRHPHVATPTNPFRGVSWDKNRKKWKAAVAEDQKSINLGRYNTAEEANQVCIAKRKELGFYDGKIVSIAA